ncbi:AAA family ATPase [Nostoc sp. 'Peltigera malacea cyanobiont' DB3992]|uniref:AAA family ATPase n=1 Tax=Nostoc sp. 'Peltigera malacea cyanobiont' DB3992 TaxID=1206980 RepID=UPI000C053253|nr:AAA family ATPase [Nostoc sp. 'Peltigera malacea cyanobiont' DB3992]PHM11702.1 histidine kinase [Nostoc sp. 'Peltigera malacea cyanobiont' DB3992]
MVSIFINIPGYRISEELYNGSRTLVYRGVRETDSLPVVTKLLKNPYPGFSELLSFRNQYTIAKNLNSPLIVQTYSLESYQNGYALVMEDFGGISLKDYFTSSGMEYIASLEEFLEIAIALCNTLDILYRERIIHKDIKPANVLINPETKQVKLIDFSIASLLPRETQTLINPNVLEGSLAYISPEQTGRMNRGIDYRTDFYSLGVTFYELLTGVLPFQSNDPMELVHSHIAKPAPLVDEINSQIPSVISEIVSKLMAKNAEDRYQSALGLKFDLENCLYQLQVDGIIKGFQIAQRDLCDRFIIPDKLYGRETEVETLLQAFERVSTGATEMMLVAGFSGIGKTVVVNEVHKPIVKKRGYFIKGKYDQFQRNIPFSAFVQAFRDLMGQLLTESDAQIQQFKTNILAAVGDNGQVIIEVIPELERIIGQQPPATELSGTAAQNRFNLLFQKFTQVFTSEKHPLVMFLDDLQWADSASLMLIQLLMADTKHLFLIGAYRDNEVNSAHPLMLTLNDIQKTAATINTITLAPLSQSQVNQLVVDTLKSTKDSALPVSQLVFQKTQGNPFFTIQFLKALHQDGLIEFTPPYRGGLRGVQCDITQINQQAVTDDVVKFMVFQLQRLPQSTQNVLQLAACIGNQFDLATLAIVWESSEIETAASLWKALQEGLILPISDVYKFYQNSSLVTCTERSRWRSLSERSISHWSLENNKQMTKDQGQRTASYRFLHDRVQQAAYSLIPDNQKQATHLKIGQLLLENSSQIEQEEKLFDIVGHLNLGQELIAQPHQQEALARLNLAAAGKAKNSTAYAAARAYLQTGIELLTVNCWQEQYELTLSLYVAAAEAAYLNADFDGMEQIAVQVLQSAQTILDKVKIYEIQIAAQTAQSRLLEAIAVGRDALKQLGVELPIEPNNAEIGKALQVLASQLAGKRIEELADLPVMTDPQAQAAMQLLGMLFAPVFQGMPGLLPLISCTMVSLSLQFGNTPASTVGYALHGMVLCAFLGEVEGGYGFGQLGLNLLDRFNVREFKSIISMLFGGFIQHHQEALLATIPLLKAGFTSGMETGDFLHAGYNVCCYSYAVFWSGSELGNLELDIASYNAALTQAKQHSAQTYVSIMRQAAQNFREIQIQPDCLSGSIYDETVMIPKHRQANELTVMAELYIYKLLLAYSFGDYKAAIAYIEEGEKYLLAVSGLIFVPISHFYAALTHLALFSTQPEIELSVILAQVEIHQTTLYRCAQNAPTNHLHKWHLVEAEKQRVLGNKAEALENYDRAITLVKANGYIQEEALSNELVAKFYLDWGKERVAQAYMQEAYYCYARWGAKAKIEDLEKRYPQLLQSILQQQRINFNTLETISFRSTSSSTRTSTTGSTSISQTLDFTSVLKAAQAISSSLELDQLIASLTQIILENSGAKKAVLILPQDEDTAVRGEPLLREVSGDNWQVRAITFINHDQIQTILEPQSLANCQDIPAKIINYVKNTQQTVVIDNCKTDTIGLIGEYMHRTQPQSVLCTPIINQGRLIGILYLENQLTQGVFTSDRLSLINFLCTQAAISLENAQLYNHLQEREKFLSSIYEGVGCLICVIDVRDNGKFEYTGWSKSCELAVGIPASQVLGKTPQDLHGDESAAVSQNHLRCFQTGIPITYEECLTFNDQKTWWLTTLSPLKDGTGKVYRIVVTTINISDRKQAESAVTEKSQALGTALEDLQQAQLQIVQSEKMSALGNLVAGVAHEMNNPLGFIAASLKQAKPTIADVVQHLKLYQESLPNPGAEIIDHAEEIDLDYSLEDLPKAIDSMVMACDRLKNISTSLRTFSRADKDYKVPFKIHEGIESTILILKHRLKANEQRPAIEVITDYGSLPPVECFPGQLNQVFMNILANAIDALDESNTGRTFAEIQEKPNKITIQTSLQDNQVKITIADNANGMNEAVKQKIFDHLFTTKSVGKGTGLGLAIARQIVVEKHGGSIHCNSSPGKGTEFAIVIPVRH